MTKTLTLTAPMAALLPVGCALLLGCAGTPKKQVPTPPPVTAPEPTPVAATVPDKPLDVTLRLDTPLGIRDFRNIGRKYMIRAVGNRGRF